VQTFYQRAKIWESLNRAMWFGLFQSTAGVLPGILVWFRFRFAFACYNISMHLQWTDYDPETNERRFIRAERFAGKWTFAQRATRRGIWEKITEPEKQLWIDLLESLERRLARREGIELADVATVKKMLENWKDPPTV